MWLEYTLACWGSNTYVTNAQNTGGCLVYECVFVEFQDEINEKFPDICLPIYLTVTFSHYHYLSIAFLHGYSPILSLTYYSFLYLFTFSYPLILSHCHTHLLHVHSLLSLLLWFSHILSTTYSVSVIHLFDISLCHCDVCLTYLLSRLLIDYTFQYSNTNHKRIQQTLCEIYYCYVYS